MHDRKVRPLRELRREHPTHERNVGVDLVGMHFASGHEPPCPAPDDARLARGVRSAV